MPGPVLGTAWGPGPAASEPDRSSAKRPRLTTNRPRGRDIILLSLFDGVGAAPYIIDRDARAWRTRTPAMVVWCAAPPCQDFSRVAQKAGHQGDRGRLFEDELRAALKSHRFAFLYENVEMNAEAAKVSSDALGVQPVFVCPSDLRPRLWWLSVDWTRLASDPTNRSPLEWAKKGRRLAAVRASADSFDLGGLEFHSSVAQGRKLMPCATTPAPTDSRRRRPVAGRWAPVRPMALHGGGHAPGRQGSSAHPASGGEVAARPRDQEHTRALLDELVAETRLGRVMGPCAAPDHWSVPTVALPSVADMGVLRQPPPGDCFAALSFAICQVDENGELKLRRGEDWRRSGHNATMGASDVPTHHFLGDIVDLVLRAGVWPRPPERLSPVGGSPPRALRHLSPLGRGRDALVPLRHVLRRRGERVEL